MTWAARIIAALVVLPVAAFLGYVALDALRFAARSIRDAVREALARLRQARADDPFDEYDSPAFYHHVRCFHTLGCAECDRYDALAFAAITRRLAGDFAYLDIRRLEALYLVPGRRD